MEIVNINAGKYYTCKKIDKTTVEGQKFIVRLCPIYHLLGYYH